MGFNPTGLTGWQYNAVFQRVPSLVDMQYKILTYGVNNLYPQEVEQVRLASPLVKSSTEVLEDFLNGTGWECRCGFSWRPLRWFLPVLRHIYFHL